MGFPRMTLVAIVLIMTAIGHILPGKGYKNQGKILSPKSELTAESEKYIQRPRKVVFRRDLKSFKVERQKKEHGR